MPEGTEVAIRPAQPLAERLMSNTVEGMEGLDRKVIGGLFQRLRIQNAIRSAKDAGGQPGQYRLGDRYLPSPVRFVILRTHSFRSLMEGEKDKKQTVCASSDNKQPLAHLQYPRGANCIECEYAQWSDGPNNKRIPPPCREGIALFGVLPDEDDMPCWFLAQGVGAFKAVKELIQGIRGIRGIRSMAQPVIRMTTREERNGGVIYYDPVFVIEEALLPVERYIDAVRVAVKDVWHEPFVRETAPPEVEDLSIPVEGGTVPFGNGSGDLEV